MTPTLSKPVVLAAPIVRGDTTIAEVAVRKPTTGALRGARLTKVGEMDVSTMLLLLPRVTEPALLPDEVAALEPADLLSLSVEIARFFMSPAQMAQIEALTAET